MAKTTITNSELKQDIEDIKTMLDNMKVDIDKILKSIEGKKPIMTDDDYFELFEMGKNKCK